jgi:hypothetical protein
MRIRTFQSFLSQEKRNKRDQKKQQVSNDKHILVHAPPAQYISAGNEKSI